MKAPSSLVTRPSKLVSLKSDFMLTALLLLYRATIEDFHKVFIAPIQVQMQIAVVGLLCQTVVSVLSLAKFKMFSFLGN